jgi:lipoyl(octanoyl) transferase
MRSLRVEKMGRVGYGPMLALQKQRHAQVLAGANDDTLFLLQHDPVITFGRNSGDEHLLSTREQLAEHGVDMFETGRGGDVTFHGPGQVVGYPIVLLEEGERDVRRFVTCLEEIIIRTTADFGIEAQRIEGLRGVWVNEAKIGAVGVRIAHWTTMHGFALNVLGTDGFRHIVPCGLHGRPVTSIAQELGRVVPVEMVEERLAVHAAEVLSRQRIDQPATGLPKESSSGLERRSPRADESMASATPRAET